jgi:PAS domain S-box-containing protein
MIIKNRILFLIILILLGFDVLMLINEHSFVAEQSILMNSERNRCEHLTDLLLETQRSEMQFFLDDYTHWNSLADFTAHPTSDWSRNNLDSVLVNYHLDLFSIYDRSGKRIYHQSRLHGDISFRTVELEDLFRNGIRFFYSKYAKDPLYIGGAAIRRLGDSGDTGDQYGYVVIGRLYSPGIVSNWERQYQSRIDIISRPPSEVSQSSLRTVRSLNDEMNQPQSWIVFYGESPVSKELIRHERRESTLFLFTSLVLVGILAVVLHRWVSAPLARLKEGLQKNHIDTLQESPEIDTEIKAISRIIAGVLENQRIIQEENASLNQANQLLSAGQHRYQAICDHIPITMFTVNTTGQYIDCTPEWARILGFTPETVLGKTNQELLPGPIGELLDTLPNETTHGQLGSREVDFVNEGVRRVLFIHYLPFTDNKGVTEGVFGYVQDISELRQYQEDLANRRMGFSFYLDLQDVLRTPRSWTVTVPEFLPRFASEFGADRVTLFSREPGNENPLLLHLVGEWNVPGAVFHGSSRDTLDISVYHSSWINKLLLGKPLSITADAVELLPREQMERNGIKSLLIVPIVTESELIGLLILIDCKVERQWPYQKYFHSVAQLIAAADTRQTLMRTCIDQRLSFSHMIDQLEVPALLIDTDDFVRLTNRRMFELFGFSRSEFQERADVIRWLAKRQPDPEIAAATIAARFQQSLLDESPISFPPFTVETTSGMLREIEVRCHTMLRQQLVFLVDRTDFHAQAHLDRQLRALFEATANLIDEGMWIGDRTGHTIHANVLMTEMLGFKTAPGLDTPLPDDNAQVVIPLIEASDEETVRFDNLPLRDTAGNLRIVSGTVSAIPTGERIIIARDVTAEARKSSETIHEHRQLLALFDHSPLPAFRFMPVRGQWALRSMNEAARALLNQAGITSSQYAENILGDAGIQTQLQTCADERTPVIRDFTEAPALFPIRIEARSIFLPVSPDTVLLQLVDFTQLGLVRDAFALGERHFRYILESLNEGVAVMDADNCLTYLNPRVPEMFGYPESELLGHNVYDLVTHENRLRIRKHYESLKRGEESNLILELLRGDGEPITVIVETRILRNATGQYQGVIAGLIDISGFALATHDLGKSQNRLATVLDHIPHLIHARNARGEILLANRALADAFSIPTSEICGMNIQQLITDPESQSRELEEDQAVLSTGQSRIIPERLSIDKRGMYHWYETVKSPFNDQGENALLVISFDVSHRKLQEQALEKRFDMERFLARLSAHCVSIEFTSLSGMLGNAADQVIRFFGADICFIENEGMIVTRPAPDCTIPDLSPAGERILVKDKIITWPFATEAINSTESGAGFIMALEVRGELVGRFGIFYHATDRIWASDDIQLLILVGEFLASAIDRFRTRDVLDRYNRASKLLWNSTRDMVFILRWPDGEILKTNKRAETVLHLDVSNCVFDHCEPSKQESLREYLKSALDGYDVTGGEYTLRSQDGPIPVEMSCCRLKSDTDPHIFLVARDVSTALERENQIQASLREKETLLREVNHRVKNNLLLIASILNLQIEDSDEPAVGNVLTDTLSRIHAIAMVHQRLYETDNLTGIDIEAYLSDLLSQLGTIYRHPETQVEIVREIEPVRMPLPMAIPCALIVNELLSNAMKHAFNGRSQGRVEIALRSLPDSKIEVIVADNGCGLPDAAAEPHTLGLQLVDLLTRQLNGTLEIHSQDGASFRIVFPYMGDEK